MIMSELKKLETNEYSSKLDEIAKNDTEVFLKVKLSGRRTFGEYEFEPKNGFAVDFGNHMDVLDLDKCDVYQLDQPQLNENQQIVLDWLKEERTKNPELTIFGTLSVLFDESENRCMSLDVIDALIDLSNSQQAGVFQAFSKWALEQEEE